MSWRSAAVRLGPLSVLGFGAVIAASAASGCTGDLGDSGALGAGESPLCATALSPGQSPIRRLTGAEYDNTVRDLLGDDTHQAAAFVPEEEALGFDNQATALTASRLLSEQYMVAAENIAAAAVSERLTEILPCEPAEVGASACGRAFVDHFAPRAFRRPLWPGERERLVGVFDWGLSTFDFETGVALVIETALQSVHFLYRVEFGMPDPVERDVVPLGPYEMASRLSYFIYGSMPDAPLFEAAERGELSTPEQVAAQARRMLGDVKARRAVERFHEQWLGLKHLETLHKDTSVYPTYTTELRSAWRAETLAFVSDVVFDGEGDLHTLLTAPYTMMNAELAAFYGAPFEGGEGSTTLERTPTDPSQRAGVLTQASVLAAHAKPNQSSPIHRGKFVREQLLCQLLPAPPNDVEIELPALDPSLTTRERFDQHSTDPTCKPCHQLIDPIGFGFESYDGIGQWRDEENGKPVDASGEIVGTPGLEGSFEGVVELAHRLAGSEALRSCVATQWFRFGYGRGEQVEDSCTLERVGRAFADSGYDIQELIVALTLTDAFRYRHAVDPS